jgi:hypothetical protein
MKLRKRWLVAAALGLILAIAGVILPIREIVEWAEFKIRPEQFKVDHLVRFWKPDTGQGIVILGTVHNDHVAPGSRYPLWQLKAVILGLKPDMVLVEIKPEAAHADHWAEGPIEMPFCALVAQDAGIRVNGMDYWRIENAGKVIRNSGEREDRMFENILSKSSSTRRALVVTGYSHLTGFSSRLRRAGFRDEAWPEAERQELLKHEVEHVYPARLKVEIIEAVERAQRGDNDFDKAWADRRREFAASISSR